MNKEKNYTKELTNWAVLAMLLAILLGIFYIVPQISKVKKLSDTVASKEEDLNRGLEEVASIKEFALLMKTARSEIEKLGVSIPQEEKADEALLQAASAASVAGISVSGVSVDTQAPQQSRGAEEGSTNDTALAGVVSLTVTTGGEYGKTIDFMKNLEKNLRPVTIKNVALSANGETSGNVDGSFVIEFPYVAAASSEVGAETITEEVNE